MASAEAVWEIGRYQLDHPGEVGIRKSSRDAVHPSMISTEDIGRLYRRVKNMAATKTIPAKIRLEGLIARPCLPALTFQTAACHKKLEERTESWAIIASE